MDQNSGNRKNAGQANSYSVSRIVLELLADLVGFQEGAGLPCSHCTCLLGFHLVRNKLECHHCGCFNFRPFKVHIKQAEEYRSFAGRNSRECVRCGRIKLTAEFCDDSSECYRCSGMKRPIIVYDEPDEEEEFLDDYDRIGAARKVLAELTE